MGVNSKERSKEDFIEKIPDLSVRSWEEVQKAEREGRGEREGHATQGMQLRRVQDGWHTEEPAGRAA